MQFVLVHGAWHASWCWYKLVPLLEDRGHRVSLVDLPGHGTCLDELPFKAIRLTHYVEAVIQLIRSLDGKVVLLGHSFAGMVISQVANDIPHKIARLIYLSACLPEDGETFWRLLAKINYPALSNCISKDSQQMAWILSEQGLKGLFYRECSEQDKYFAWSHINPEPYRPYFDSVSLSYQNFDEIPKSYIQCAQDYVIRPEVQQYFIERSLGFDQCSLPAGHAVFFSHPEYLASCLHQIVLL